MKKEEMLPKMKHAEYLRDLIASVQAEDDRDHFTENWKSFLSWVVHNRDYGWYISYDAPMVFRQVTPRLKPVFTDDMERSDINIKATVRNVGRRGCTHPYSVVLPPHAYRFFEALSHFGIQSLNRCPHCKRIFFNPTKRRKRYCGPRCQNAAGSQRVRDKKKQAEMVPI